MYLLQLNGWWIQEADNLAFLASLVISAVFYRSYRKLQAAIDKEEMIERFLK